MNIDQTHSCKKCGSIDVSLDLSTGKITCFKCKYEGYPKKVNFQDIIDNRNKPKQDPPKTDLIDKIRK